MRLVGLVIAVAVAAASPASAATIHGLVFEDIDGDGRPSPRESGVGNAVVALGVAHFAVTDARGQFDLEVPDGARGIVWVRVPDGFRPGPVWARYDGRGDVDLALRRLPEPTRGPVTFVVAADTHLPLTQEHITVADFAAAASSATAIDPAPAFFTILGDITQGTREFDLVDEALEDLPVPYVPVPGNHDWYDGGAAWFAHYGPDNYSFDVGDTHFVVWNMAMKEAELRAYLGAELARVAPEMMIVVLTHAPPSPEAVAVLRALGVDYVLTGHAHSNRTVDHDGVIELNTQPMLMGGLDFTPAGYRVVTIDQGRLVSQHRTTVDEPFVAIVSPAAGACTPAREATLLVASELDAGTATLTARVDCASPLALKPAGGWTWQTKLPPLSPGVHTLTIDAVAQSGTSVRESVAFEVCAAEPAPPPGYAWPQIGGNSTHVGARANEIAPPLVTRWTTAVGGHVVTAAPIIAAGIVYVAVSDLGDGDAGGVVALDLVNGTLRWKVPTRKAVRGGLAIAGANVVVTQIDGVTLGLDSSTGTERWRYAMSAGLASEAGALFSPPSVDAEDVFVGHQRKLAAIDGARGTVLWADEPVPQGRDSQSAAALAIHDQMVVGTFNRAFGGVIAWDRTSGKRLWSFVGAETIGINASPVIANDSVFIVNAADEVTALDLGGHVRWRAELDPAGFEWGNATIGTPAYAGGVLVVPTLYRDLVALDAATGAELWRFAGIGSPLRATHYRGPRQPGFAASPVITGDIVWAVDTAGVLSALELRSGEMLWQQRLGVPVLAGLAVSGDWLVAASYDGTVRALAPTPRRRTIPLPPSCSDVPPPQGCCDASRSPISLLAPALLVAVAAYVAARRRSRRRRA